MQFPFFGNCITFTKKSVHLITVQLQCTRIWRFFSKRCKAATRQVGPAPGLQSTKTHTILSIFKKLIVGNGFFQRCYVFQFYSLVKRCYMIVVMDVGPYKVV